MSRRDEHAAELESLRRESECHAAGEERYRTLVELSPEPIYVTRAGRILYLNPAAARIFGAASPGELMGTPILDRVHPDFVEQSRGRLQRLAHGTAHEPRIECTFLAMDGTPFDVEIEGTAIHFDGAPAVHATLHDITARRHAEAALRAIVHASPVPMARNDARRNITFLNPAFSQTFGYAQQDIPTLADWWRQAYPDPAYRAGVAAAWEAELERSRTGQTAFPPVELNVACKDGSTKTVIVSAAALSDGGEETQLVSLFDITERKQAEAALRLRSAALEAAANAIVLTDRRGVIEWANAAFTTFTGYTPEEAIGRNPGELLKSGIHDREFYRGLWETILDGRVWRGEMVNRRKDGGLYTEEMTITPLKGNDGEIAHFIAVKQDITRRKALEEQFRQVQKLESVGRLAGGVAHDFNNMLGVILGHSDLALLEEALPGPLRVHLSEIQAAARRSADLTRQLLAFARRQNVAPRVLDLNETVTALLGMLQRMIGEDVHIAWRPADGLWPIAMDPSQMDQVLTNLCVNARDAMADVGTLAISTANCAIDETFCAAHAEASPGEYVRLTVSDTGCGMEPDVLAQVFEPFFTTKPVGTGTGLGLATVYGAVRQNLGFVIATSSPGEGATFDIYLPRHHRSPTSVPAARDRTDASAPRGSETVLLVEDEPALLALAQRVLEAQGYTVLGARGPAEALELARSHGGTIDLLLTDVIMPEMNGRDLARALQESLPRLKRLYMSGYAASALARHGVLEEGTHFIAKPFALTALAEKVRAVLDRD